MPALIRFGQLCGLASFAVAAPLFDLLAGGAGFFVAHGIDAAGITWLMIALLLVPPLGLWLVVQAAALVGHGFVERIHIAALSLLFALAFLPPLHRGLEAWGGASVAIAGVLGVAFALAYARWLPLQRLALLSGLAPVLFALQFLSHSEVRAFWDSATPVASEPAATATLRGPVIVVMFDELPLSSLLDRTEEIDRVRYPAFAALADTSTWLRSVSAVSTYTQEVIPAILSGRYPAARDNLPIYSRHPDNLFSLLAPTHALNIHETLTQLRPPAQVLATEAARSAVAENGAAPSSDCLTADLVLLYAHLVVPSRVRERLPPVDRGWSCWWRRDLDDVGGQSPAVDRGTHRDGDLSDAERKAWMELRRRDAKGRNDYPQMFRRFIRSIPASHRGRKPGQGSLHFIHLAFPHMPWRFTPRGTRYGPYQLHGNKRERWSEEPWWGIEAYQRHLLQLGLADRLLGELLANLRLNRLFDEALLVVGADHGVGFWPGEKRRSVDDGEHPEDILSIPLFIKRPYQEGAERNDVVGESVDILPSIADLLGAQIPGEIDGCSLFAADCPRRQLRHAMVADGGGGRTKREFPADIVYRKSTLERKLDAFGSGPLIPSLYRFGPFRDLVGEQIDQLEVRTPVAGEYLEKRGSELDSRVGVRISLRLKLDSAFESDPHVAIALNDRIETVVPAPRDSAGERLIVAMLPEEHLRGRGDRIEIYLVATDSSESAATIEHTEGARSSITPNSDASPVDREIWLHRLRPHR